VNTEIQAANCANDANSASKIYYAAVRVIRAIRGLYLCPLLLRNMLNVSHNAETPPGLPEFGGVYGCRTTQIRRPQ